MPEGDSVYRFAGRIRDALQGRPIVRAAAHGPGPVPKVHLLEGATCTEVTTNGKNLFIAFDNGLVIRGHLRMYGTWHIYRPGEAWQKPEREARLVLETPESVAVNFSAPVVELMEKRALAHHAPVAKLGPDLLGENVDLEQILGRFRDPIRAGLTIGDAIMDQEVMAGVGNIWKHETLFRAGLNPWKTVADLDDATLTDLARTARDLLRASVGMPDADGNEQRRPSYFVYGRPGQPCRRCYTRLKMARQGRDIRYTTWCPRCQPGPDGPSWLPRAAG